MGNLVLTRKQKQSIKVVIEGKVVAEITLLGTSRSDAQMAFEAEPHVKFYRSEVWERVKQAMESDESILKGNIESDKSN